MRPLTLPRVPARAAITCCATFALVLAATASPASATVALNQKPGAAGCISSDLPGLGCAPGKALSAVNAIVVSPDGRNAYAVSQGSYAVDVFDRAADGTLTQKAGTAGCVVTLQLFGPVPGTCAIGIGLEGADALAISPDGRNVYAGGYLGDAVAVFDRTEDGTLTQKAGLAGCVSETGAGGCADGSSLQYILALDVSPDGKSVYAVAVNSHAIAVFDRAADGGLTQKAGAAGCVSDTGNSACTAARGLGDVHDLTTSPDGLNVYATAYSGGSVVVLDRAGDGTLTQKPGLAGCVSESTTGGACVFGRAMRYASSVAVSPDGTSVYVTSSGAAVALFDRAAGGALTQKPGSAGCVSSVDTGGGCRRLRVLGNGANPAVSPDGTSIYFATIGLDSNEQYVGLLAMLDRAPEGLLTQPAGTAGCVSETGSGGECADGRAVNGASGVAFSPDGASVYVAALPGSAVAVFDRGGTVVAPPLPPPPPPPLADVVDPVVRGLSVRPARFRALSSGPSVVARRGAKITYRLSEPAGVRFTVQLVLSGRRVGGRCAAARATNRSAPRCDRYRTLAPGSFKHAGAKGSNVLRFSGRLRNRRLAAGRYRLRALATDVAGNRSRFGLARFAIRR